MTIEHKIEDIANKAQECKWQLRGGGKKNGSLIMAQTILDSSIFDKSLEDA